MFSAAILATSLICYVGPGTVPKDIPKTLPAKDLASLEHECVPWYIRSGQWRADVRSLAAVLRYLAESDVSGRTNPLPTRADKA
jgi:hypothetical protein